MQHKRSRLSTKILAFVLILALVFPASAFASVADVAKDTRSPGKSLANTYPAYTDIDWQISLAEDATATVTLPTNLTENELAAAMDAGLSLSLDRDTQRGYLNPEKFPNPYQGGPLDSWKTQRDTQMFQVDDYGFAFDDDGKVSLVLYLNISCYFANRSGSVDYSAPHSNGGAYLDLCGYYTLRVTADGKDIASCHAKVVPYDSFRTVYELYDDLEALAAYYNVQENRVNVKELLGDVFMVIVPEQNIEGYEHMTRTTGQGYDPNRDEANQTLFEDANAMALVNKFNPMVFTEIHGRVEAMLIEPCTPPHEPNYEYDLIAKQFIQLGEAVGMGAIANNPEHNSFEMPYRDYLRVDNDSPSGVAWTEPWDDMTTAYGSQFPVLIGTAGITWELPVYSDVASELVVPYGLMTQAMYIQANKITMLENQAKLFSRGVNNTNSNELVAPWYVDQYDRPGTQTELMRPVYDGEGQNGNFYPECYIIPMDSANQKNLYDAAAEMKYLTRNDVKVNVASKEFTYDGVTYPAGTMVVSMYQAKRSLANSQLFDGTFINVWQGLYSESFAQRSNARGYDRVIVAEPAAYKTIMAACPETINYTQALTYLAAFATQFEGVENADVIIDNVSNDSAAAVNALLRAGKTVAIITEGSEKGNFICSYEDFMTVAKDYVLTATGVYGAGIKAAVILNPQVYLPGKPADNTSGYVETTLRSGSYNYRFDWLALTAMGFTMTDDLTKANVIVGSRALSDDALAAVKAGTPYMGYSNDAITGRSAFMQELGVEISSCDKGTDFLGRVVYPNNTLVNATYINDGPKTGDSSNIIVWVLAASFSCVMIPAAVTLKRKAR